MNNVKAMEEFCQLMESPSFLQQQQYGVHLQPHMSFSDSFDSRPDPQPQLFFSDSFGSRSHHKPEHQPQLSFSNRFGGPIYQRLEPQPQLSFSDSFGRVQRIPEQHHHQQPQLSFTDSFGRATGLPGAWYSKTQVSECNLVTAPVKRAEKHHNIREESIDREAGDFIKMKHNKFNLSK